MRLEALHVLVAVPGDAALPPGRREQPALLVEADRVDRDVGAAGELLHPPALRFRLGPHEWSF